MLGLHCILILKNKTYHDCNIIIKKHFYETFSFKKYDHLYTMKP